MCDDDFEPELGRMRSQDGKRGRKYSLSPVDFCSSQLHIWQAELDTFPGTVSTQMEAPSCGPLARRLPMLSPRR